MNQINISMVAKKAQVSNSTVSRVLNDSPLVRPETANKVKAIIAELGYQPSEIARGLRMNETKTIGVIVSNVLNHFSLAWCAASKTLQINQLTTLCFATQMNSRRKSGSI